MDEQNNKKATVKKLGKALLSVGILAFFIYSYQSIMDLQIMGDPIRQEGITHIFQALSEPDILEYETEELNVEAPVYLPCRNGEKPALPKTDINRPYLVATPSCGAAFKEIIVEGFNMPSFAEGPLYFITSSGVRKQLGVFSVDENGYFIVEVELPNRQPVEEAQALRATVSTNVGSPEWSANAIATLGKMIETIQMAFLTTVFAAILAALFSFLLLKTSSGKLRIFNTLIQLIFVAIRSVHPLIVTFPAIIFV
ncbi:MAG: hypothetical protein GY755_24840 [Chloroflexi bacterium]|nr:hypothetical protein [Chloroflexota bacterium]